MHVLPQINVSRERQGRLLAAYRSLPPGMPALRPTAWNETALPPCYTLLRALFLRRVCQQAGVQHKREACETFRPLPCFELPILLPVVEWQNIADAGALLEAVMRVRESYRGRMVCVGIS
jgi:hypothetical protein